MIATRADGAGVSRAASGAPIMKRVPCELAGLVLLILSVTVACSRGTPLQPDPIPGAASRGGDGLVLDDAEQGGRPLSTTMSGAQEAPGPGDPDGSGNAVITLNHGQGQICFELTVSNIDPATAAHIHEAPPGVPGPVVVPLTPPTSGSSSGCVSVARDLIKDIIQNPGEYYVNVHNSAFEAGAIRGQLAR
jgi:CHRD domain